MLNKYLINNFFNSFFTLFAILFILASMVLLLTISNVTAVLKINLAEFTYLYILSLPEIVFYTLPLTFFITSALSIARLFENLELISVLALGTSPKKILKPFFILSLFLTIFLLIITFLSIPTSQILYKNFMNVKKTESQFNFSASSIGQKFGDWNLFISGKSHNSYQDVILFNPDKNSFITANSAQTYRVGNYFVLALTDGIIYSKNKDKLSEIKFQKFHLNQKISTTVVSLGTISEYIHQYKDKTNKYFLIALFPFVSFFFLAGISFFHYRYEKNRSVIYSLAISIGYYVSVFISYKKLYAVFIIVPVFLILSFFVNKKAKRF